jgi:hypothetical protein
MAFSFLRSGFTFFWVAASGVPEAKQAPRGKHPSSNKLCVPRLHTFSMCTMAATSTPFDETSEKSG